MKIYSREIILCCAFLAAALFTGCQTASQNTNVSPTAKEINAVAPVRVSAQGIDAAEPAVAADADGNVYVVYVEHGANNSADLYFQKFDKNRNPAGEKKRVNPETGKVKAWFGDAPTIKIGNNNVVFIGWTAKVESAENSNASNLRLSVSRDGGNSFDAPVKVNDDIQPAAHGMHSLAIGKDNVIYLAWLDERNLKSERRAENLDAGNKNLSEPEFQFIKAHHNSNSNQAAKSDKDEMKDEAAEPNSEIFFAASKDGGKTFSPNKKLSSEVCPCCKTSIVTASDGRIYVSWRQVLKGDFRHIAVTSSINDGNNFAPPTIVSDDQWQINACPVSGAAIAAGENNTLEIVWFTAGKAGTPGLYKAKSKDGGASFSARSQVIEENIVGTSQMFSDNKNNYLLVWAANGKIFIESISSQTIEGKAKELDAGEFPASVLAANRLFVSYNKKENNRRSVWLNVYNIE